MRDLCNILMLSPIEQIVHICKDYMTTCEYLTEGSNVASAYTV